jgi:proteasome accessory factor B
VERAERLLDLVALFLNAREAIAWSEIQEAFQDDYARGSPEANIRKFERDKADLAELGLTLTYVQGEERDKDGYLLDRSAYYLPAVTLAKDELAVLYAAGAAALAEPAFPFRQDLVHALEKMAFAAGADPSLSRDWSRLSVPRERDETRTSLGRWVSDLSRAVASRKSVEMRYQAQNSGEITRRRVDPYGLLYRFGSWVLVGHCHLRGDLRTFRVDRIVELTVNAARPRSIDFEVPKDFKLADHSVTRPWEFRRHAPMEVVVRLGPDMAFLTERTFQGARRQGSDRKGVRLILNVSDSEALLRAILPLGPGVEILSPEKLRQQTRALLERMLEQNRGHRPAERTAARGAR